MWAAPKTEWKQTEFINIEDWQRIEDNTRWIADFYGLTLQYKTWEHTSWPTPNEVARIESNINALLKQTHSFQAKFDWNLLNDIENCLLIMHARVVELQLSVRRSGTFSAGQNLYIPIGGI
ncbi:hypothetical protein [Caproiciproducens galactitolivorans]|uniref:Uncharacterized protein n=1 Tax=Caproiciproducens galactitolivorans TaxID=642589 RepID=A0ABT4BWG3_9FIRM|nr:hypothetical protein [Caproiciproducens galactitolivorans]MCY1715233.1 hypothetical protein [Caproiciproducens galactitolivorans]